MPQAWRCRMCKGPPIPQPPEGACENCGRFARHDSIHVREGEIDGAEIQPLREGEPISAYDLLANFQNDETMQKRPTGMKGIDHVFGGGLPYFGAILLCAKEGSGKTSLLWELFLNLAKKKIETMYISSEQSEKDLARQLARCGPAPAKHMTVLAQTDRDAILRALEKRGPRVAAIDSLHEIEGVTDEDGYSMASGGDRTVTRVAKEVRRLAGELECLVFLVGHMNNDGSMAGSAHLRHAVDGTLGLTYLTDDKDPRRILAFERKTRFGPHGRQALFVMREDGFKDLGPYEKEDEREELKSLMPRRNRDVN